MRLLLPAILSLTIGLAACNNGSIPSPAPSASSSSSSEDANLVTHNVSFAGTIDELGVTAYQQGTHKLMLPDGQFLILESTDVNLNLSTYLGKRVEIHGSLQPTVEAGGMLLKAEEVIVLDTAASSSASSAETTDGNNKIVESSAAMSSSSVTQTSSSVSSSMKASASSSSVLSVFSSQSSLPAISLTMEQQIVALAKQTYVQDNLWTQKYCTSHIAFCVPVHKNWYYKSFGATTSNLWHVEFDMMDISELGDGAIILNLVAGSSASVQAQDSQIKSQGSDVIGFRDWQNGTHFEIIADARLKAAVVYMLSHISPYVSAQ